MRDPTWNAGSVCGDGSKFAPATSRKRADDRTKEDRYVLGAGPPDLWDSWSKVLGEIKTRIEKTGPVLFLPAFLRVLFERGPVGS